MTKDDLNADETVSPQQERAPTPLVSAAELSISEYPSIHISENRLYALSEHAHRIADTWHGTPQDHLTGLLGEDALAHYLGIADELNVDLYTDGGDGGIDLRYSGASLQVKTVGQHRSNPPLTVDIHEPLTADYYVLASRIGATDFRIIGYTPRWFVKNAPVFDNSGERYHLIEQDFLFPFIRNPR